MTYKISLSAVRIPKEVYPLMTKALKDTKIGGETEYVAAFEKSICNFTGAKYCVAVSNGTMADAVLLAAIKELLGRSSA